LRHNLQHPILKREKSGNFEIIFQAYASGGYEPRHISFYAAIIIRTEA